ncbi:MAG: hypothetical protein PHP10_06760 [Candidatus Omnitrophica bacterium]|nr:hypothetical protein [Candidatus Omnitrophota bacterium]
MNSTRSGIIIFCILFFSGFNLFAQPDDTRAVKPEFQKMDTSKDGFVTLDEMHDYQVKTFNDLDKDKNSTLDLKELEADKTKMYQEADKDKDTVVTPTESSAQFREYFRQMDRDRDNRISEIEYTDYWKGKIYF